MHVVVAYDITSNRRRNRLAKTLEHFLRRVQESVFEGQIEAAAFSRMKRRIQFTVDQNRDSVRIYHLCARCHPNTELLGTGSWVSASDGDEVL